MKIDQLVLSNLNITEDHYHFKGHFILKSSDKSKSVDLEELEKPSVLEDIKTYFDLEEPTKEIGVSSWIWLWSKPTLVQK